MNENLTEHTAALMKKRFGRDSLLALATAENNIPFVRAVNGYYEDGSFYVITYARSQKMRQSERNPFVALCGERFTAHGCVENIGALCDEKNEELRSKLKEIFASWYDSGHIQESDPDTCILRIRLTDGVLFDGGTRYDIDFSQSENESK